VTSERVRRNHLLRTREFAARCIDRAVAPFGGIGLVSGGNETRQAVALTFDDGPSRFNTPRLLDLLAEHEARATFFVVGESIDGNEDILQRLVALGHEVGNHTFTHPHTHALTRDQLRHELDRTNEAISASSSDVLFVRPPFGKDRRRTVSVAAELGQQVVLWSIDSGDSRGRTAEEIVAHVTRQARPGAIILFHDGGKPRPTTLEACSQIIPELSAAGLELVTIRELIGGLRSTSG
jgi:peptidoglycan/xylan/chitin deacetylase (PgdA/CDA1 family)